MVDESRMGGRANHVSSASVFRRLHYAYRVHPSLSLENTVKVGGLPRPVVRNYLIWLPAILGN